MESRTWLINGVDLTATTPGWQSFILTDTRGSNDVATRLSEVEAANRDGVLAVGTPTVAASSLGIVVGVKAATLAGRLQAQSRIASVFVAPTKHGGGQITLKTSDTPVRSTRFRLASLTWEERDDFLAVATVELQLPYPVWRATSPASGIAAPGEGVEILAGIDSSGPVQVVWRLPGTATRLRAVSHDDPRLGVVVDPGERVGRDIVISSWTPEGLGVRVSQWGPIWPNAEGVYLVDIDTDTAGIAWEAYPTWL